MRHFYKNLVIDCFVTLVNHIIMHNNKELCNSYLTAIVEHFEEDVLISLMESANGDRE